MYLLYAAYIWVLFFIQSAALCLLTDVFSPLTFKVAIDKSVLIAIFFPVVSVNNCFIDLAAPMVGA